MEGLGKTVEEYNAAVRTDIDYNPTVKDGRRTEGLALDKAWWSFLFRWLHVLGGIMWSGILYYINYVQVPNMA